MSRPLEPLQSGEPDAIDLELRLLGDVPSADDAARIDAAGQGPLAQEAIDLEAHRRAWAALAPKLRAPALPERRARGRWLYPALLAATALIAAIGLATLRPPDGLRPMGAGLPVDLTVVREGRPVTPSAARFSADDRLGVAVIAPRGGYATVATLQGDGQVFLLDRTAPGAPLAPGARFSMDGAVALDDHGGREWLVVSIHDRWRADAEVEAELRGLLPEPDCGAPTWCFEITRTPR